MRVVAYGELLKGCIIGLIVGGYVGWALTISWIYRNSDDDDGTEDDGDNGPGEDLPYDPDDDSDDMWKELLSSDSDSLAV